MELTILTPTYNRAESLQCLWKSLCRQSSKEFEWLIIDDGSSDSTDETVKMMIEKSDFNIRYIYKNNGGKHTALNVGINNIGSELTFIVDSDDRLSDDAVEYILNYHNKYKNFKEICGFAFLRAFPDGKINGKKFVVDDKIDTYIEMRINSDDTYADKAEVFYTHALKEFPFPEYKGERFLGEDIVWIRMARKYKMVHVNKAICIGDYQTDGLTKNRRKNNINSPVGCMNRAKEFISYDIKLKYRIKGALQYIIYGKFAGFKIIDLLRESEKKLFIILWIVPGMLLYKKWKRMR